MSGSESTHLQRRSRANAAPALIAVAVDGYPESRDAAALAATIAAVTTAEVMLVAVHPGAPVVLPNEMGLVFIGSCRSGTVEPLRAGSTAWTLLHDARCPTVVGPAVRA